MQKARFALASSALLMMAAIGAGAPGANAATRSAVAQGIGPAATQNTTVFGNTPANTPVTVSIILRTRHMNQLAAFIHSTVTPGNSHYRHFLSTQQFAQLYGQSPTVIHAIVQYFQQYGIMASIYPDNLDITLNGTAGEFDQAFHVTLQNMEKTGHKFHGTHDQPTMPHQLTGPILAVLGLTNYGPFSSTAVHASPTALAKLPSQDTSGTASQPPQGWQTPQTMEQNYNVTPLINAGDLGQGQTLGIVTLASIDPSDPYGYWSAYHIPAKPNRITLVNVDGGAGPVSNSAGSGETTLDVEQSGSLAPDANIIVYQAPNTDYGFVDAFINAISANKVGSLSASWGLSETAVNWLIQNGYESPNYAQAFNEAFQEAAAQGISTFAATGDYGAYQAVSDLGTTNLAVGNPADSPYVTAAGGTTLPSSQSPILPSLGITVPQQRAWAWDYFFPYWKQLGGTSEASFAESSTIGSNGGYSVIFPEPSYQRGISGIQHFHAVQWFTPIDNNTAWDFNPNPPVVSGRSNGGRAMPDVSLDADPYTGYTIYSQALYGGWSVGWGGTSFVAPQLNGITALINAAAGGRVGFWNPQIYRFAKGSNSPFTPLDTTGTGNDNLYYTGTPGTIYNAATGLGTPNVAALTKSFMSGQ
ncbi:S53 family peptidase [Sulfobacillus harzensis]|uniref:S8/S53 family peptidase n=1 Tax=Sulfobacillus harzensis TaxID=2729629 RepID=A0A7Y0Q3D7_9FIRM|nr:S53 family peptidase [Sulfobacillus harzensis]NMP23285.1 S8/S53 family peptidase [Sulfobacillus harzensis]